MIVLQKYHRDQAPLEQAYTPHRIQTSAVKREIWRSTPARKIVRIDESMAERVYIDGEPEQ